MTQKTKGNTRVASALRKLKETGTAAGYVPEEEQPHSITHKLNESDIKWVDIDLIKDSPFQHEEQIDPEKFAALVASIQQDGLWHAFNVMEDPEEPGTYILTNGMHQRRKAAKAAGHTQVPIYIGPTLDRKHLAARAARENTTDVNRSKVNLGYLFVQMNEELGMSQEEIATEIGQNREFVKLCIMAAKSAPDIQKMVFEKPDSVRAMTYLRRIKANILPEEGKIISGEEHKKREEDAAALRAPIIEQFLRGDLSTDGVQAEVEKVLSLLEMERQKKHSNIPQASVRENVTIDSQDHENVNPHDVLMIEDAQAESEVVTGIEPTQTGRPEESRNAASATEEPTVVVTTFSPLVKEEEPRFSERIGQAKATLSRLRTYQRIVGDNVLTDEERKIIESCAAITQLLLGKGKL